MPFKPILKMAKNYIKKSQLHFGLDFLKIYWTFKKEELFEKLNFTNSNYWELEDYTFTKNDIKKYKYWITFTKNNHTLFSYVKWDPLLTIPSKDCLTVYWVAFKVLDISEIIYFLWFYFYLKQVKRFDICIDLELPMEIVTSKFKKLDQIWWDIFGKKWVLETRYIWNTSNIENKRQLIRIYNKIRDIKEKWKELLYQDYLLKENVTRIELEVRRELTKNINYLDLFNEDYLKKIFKNYFRLHTDLFQNICNEKLTLYSKPKEITDEEKQGMYYKNLYKVAFNGYARNIIKAWSCPVRILIWEWLIRENTKLELWRKKVNKIHRFEQEVKRKYLYLKNERYEKRN